MIAGHYAADACCFSLYRHAITLLRYAAYADADDALRQLIFFAKMLVDVATCRVAMLAAAADAATRYTTALMIFTAATLLSCFAAFADRYLDTLAAMLPL